MATTKYKDVAEDRLASATSKQRNALNHFQLFLDDYLPQFGDIMEVEDIPFKGLGLPRRASPKDTNEFWSKLMGCFVDYLSTATYYRNPNKRLAEASADGFFSSVKEYFTTKFRHETPIPVFNDPQWGKLRSKLKGKFRESSRGRLPKKKPSSTREDRETLAKAAFWQATATSSEFLHLLNSTFHCSARGSEVSLIAASGTSAIEATESVYRYRLLQVDCQRQKNGPFHEIQIYPDADGVLEDWYFSLIYMLVLSGCDSEYMFPRYSAAALSTVDGKSKSTVPALWKSDFDELLDSLDEMNLSVNKALRSHCNKRGSQQLCAESPSASGLSQYFRAGWQSAANTMLKYIAGSVALERPAAKAVAKWPARDGCGQPVMFDDILVSPGPHSPPSPPSSQGSEPVAVGPVVGERDKLQRFTDSLFEDDQDGLWDQKVRELLVSTLLLRYDQFLDVLRDHPKAWIPDCTLKEYDPQYECFDLEKSQDYDTIRDNLFVCKVNQAMEKAEVDPVLFKSWCEYARNAFLTRNIDGLPIQNFSLYGSKRGGGVSLDPRRFTDHFNQLASVTQSTHVVVQELRHRLNDLTDIVRHEQLRRAYDNQQFSTVCESVRLLKNHLLPSSESSSTPTPSKGVIKFSVSCKALNKDSSISDVTTKFFVDNFPAGFNLDKESESWKDMDKNQRKSLSNRFAAMKCAVRIALLHTDAFPKDPDKKAIGQMARLAEEKIRADFGFDKNERITVYKIQKHEKTKGLQSTLGLPTNLPQPMQAFFRN